MTTSLKQIACKLCCIELRVKKKQTVLLCIPAAYMTDIKGLERARAKEREDKKGPLYSSSMNHCWCSLWTVKSQM